MNISTIFTKSIIILCGFIIISCSNKPTKIYTNKEFLTAVLDSTKTTKDLLNKFTPSIVAIADSTYYGEQEYIENDTVSRSLFMGKFIDKSIIAIEIRFKDTCINFYKLSDKTWKLIGTEKTQIPIFNIKFEDLNGDKHNEIITSTAPNMNGNTWQEVYIQNNGKIKYAGSFSTDYKINNDKKEIEESYEGSWYMSRTKTLYRWIDYQLIPVRQVVLNIDPSSYENPKVTFEYYENKSNTMNGLTLKFKEPYLHNEKQNKIWDNFFEK